MSDPSHAFPVPRDSAWDSGAFASRVLDSISDGFLAFDADWRMIYLNQAARRMMAPRVGNCSTMLGRSIWDSFPDLLGTNLEREYRRAVLEQVPVAFENWYAPWKSWYALNAYPLEGGGLSVYFRDVTEQKQTAARLEASEERYHTLFRSIEEGFAVIEGIRDIHGRVVDYRYIDANAAFEAQVGFTDITGKTAREVNAGHEPEWLDIIGRVEESGEPARFVQTSPSHDHTFEVHAFLLGSPEGKHVAVHLTDISSRRQADQEMNRLREEERSRMAEMEALLEVLPIGIGIALDRECRSIRANAALAQWLGLGTDTNASKTAVDSEIPHTFRIIDDHGAEVPGENLPMQIAAREGREVRGMEVNVLKNSGEVIRLLEYAAPLFDRRGEPRGSVCAFVDITDRRAAEVRQRFLVGLDDAVRPLSRAEDIVATSARLLGEHLEVDRCAYADIEADEDTMNISGDFTRGVASIVGRYTFTQFGTEVLRLMRSNLPYVVEDIEIHRPQPEDLSAYHAAEIRAVICVPLHKAGRFVGAMAVHKKTPRRWRAEEVSLVQHVANRCWESLERVKVTRELRESEARFRQIADLMPQVVWLARSDGFTYYYNRRWYEFTGRPEGEGGDASFLPVLHPDDVTSCLTRWYACVRSGEPYEIRYRWLEAKSGEYRWFLTRAVPFRDENGQIVRWYGASTNIDELVRADEAARDARAEAERANRAKDQFLAALSHELRTPLTPVLMAAEALCEDPELPSAMHESLCMMQRNIALEARLIDDLLDLTRIAHGKFKLRLQDADAHDLLFLAMDIIKDEAEKKALDVRFVLGAERTTLRCDASRLQQVFWNLLKNAVKFTPPKGEIIVRSHNDGDRFIFEIQDTGIGLAPETLGRIFLPFEQAGLANDHRFGGLGLGLSISKAIVEMHGGTIGAESEGPGKGATFRLNLPTVARRAQPAASGEAPAPKSAERPAAAGRGMRLLVVEDHEPTLNVLARMLTRDGHRVSTSMTVAGAKEAAQATVFDAVVSDIGLPDGNGIELMRHLRASYGLHGIALTGYGMEEDMRLAYEAGFVVHLTKPVEFSQLRRALAEISTPEAD